METERENALRVYKIDKRMKKIAAESMQATKLKLYFPKNLTWSEEEWNMKGIVIKWEQQK